MNTRIIIVLGLLIIFAFAPATAIWGQKSRTVLKFERQLNLAENSDKPELECKLANAWLNDGNITTADSVAQIAVKLAKKYKKNDCRASALVLLGDIHFDANEHKNALGYYTDAVKFMDAEKNPATLAMVYHNIGKLRLTVNKGLLTGDALEKSLELAKTYRLENLVVKNTEALFDLYFNRKRYKKALGYFKEYIQIKDSGFVVENKQVLARLNRRYKAEKEQRFETERILQETDSTLKAIDSTLTEVSHERDTLAVVSQKQGETIEALNYETAYQDKLIENQRLIRNILIGGVIVFFIMLLGLYNRFAYRKKTNDKLRVQKEEIIVQRDNLKDLNKELEQQKEEITAQRDEIHSANGHLQTANTLIEKKNENITSSIRYAMQIQQAALPSPDLMQELLPKHFILYKPRDIVSGDFYWIKHVGDNIIVAAADCTGHGVPGAFVSMLGISLLNEISLRKDVKTAAEILEAMRAQIKLLLKQTGKISDQKDGMDMALCMINTKSNVIQYAGANNPLYLIRNNELQTIKATKNPIGIYPVEKPFQNHELKVEQNDMIYMFSDGYVDQFGGPKDDKFKTKRFKEKLMEINTKSPAEQQVILDYTIEDWKGSTNQLDDILVMGIRF